MGNPPNETEAVSEVKSILFNFSDNLTRLYPILYRLTFLFDERALPHSNIEKSEIDNLRICLDCLEYSIHETSNELSNKIKSYRS